MQTEVSVFEANIRLLGGLLSIHALTQNNVRYITELYIIIIVQAKITVIL